MGYYTNHIIRIVPVEQQTQENYQRIIDTLGHFPSYGDEWSMRYHHNILEDSNWNDGLGSKWYEFHNEVQRLSEELPDLEIEFLWIGEDHRYWYDEDCVDDQGRYLFKNGEMIEEERKMNNEELKWFENTYGKAERWLHVQPNQEPYSEPN